MMRKILCSLVIPTLLLMSLIHPGMAYGETTELSHPVTAWPFVSHSREQDKGETDVLWPIFRHEWQGSREKFAIRPLFNSEKDPLRDYRQISFLWPLNSYEREKDRLSLDLTLYSHRSTPESRSDIFFPVYWKGHRKDFSYFHIWPLFGVNHKGSYTEHSTLFPFFRYGEDPEKQELDVHAFWPLMNYHSSPEYLSHHVLPLYWYEKGPETSGGFIFPYYWKNTGSYQAKGVFPLWYSSRDATLKTDAVFPLYYNHESDTMSLRLLFPLYGNWEKGSTSLRFITPLYTDFQQDDLRVRIGLPVYLDYRNGPFSFSTFLPFYYRTANTDLSSEFTCYFPAYSSYKNGPSYFTTILPFYLHTGNTDLQSDFTYYFPVYGSYRKGERYQRHFLFMPAYSHYSDESQKLTGWDVMWPLLHHETSPESRSIRVFPFFWYTREPGRELTVGLPVYYSSKDPESSNLHILPLYGLNTKGRHFRKQFILGPAYIDTQDSSPENPYSRTDIMYPFYSSMKEKDRERSWLFPVFYRSETDHSRIAVGSCLLLPPYYFSYHDDQEDKFHLWPLYSELRTSTYREYGTLWPLIRHASDEQSHETLAQFLLFYRANRPGNSLTCLAPLWFHKETGSKVSDFSLLLHSYERDSLINSTKIAFLWLLTEDLSVFTYRKDDQNLSSRILWKVVSYDRSAPVDRTEFAILGITGDLGVFTYRRERDETLASRFFWRVVSYERSAPDATEFRFLWRLIRKNTSPLQDTLELNPFFYRESTAGRTTYWAFLGGLVAREISPDGNHRMRYFWNF